ncbi:hypothetical protein L210DRAFT_3480196 [Boletus edulis BED1]|uniref:Transmembrane protein n=1 Tax=Boletus edulis BED1 TaxID=1328754 RepID=A0AAD4BTD0_BOLED|nr:hypothetical protein L210DRAFT_3480196 [Boletus edulis BED1]
MSSQIHTYPTNKPYRIMASIGRTRTAPASGGFMMRHHDVDDLDRQPQPEKKRTQEEQDTEDEKARKRAMRNLVNSWQERLQLISVITTFFASAEAAILVNTKPLSSVEFEKIVLKVANATLLGALIFHVYASVLSFLGAFLLISYKLKEARREEMIAVGVPITNSPVEDFIINDVEWGPIDPGLQKTLTSNDVQSMTHNYNTATIPERNQGNGVPPGEQPVFSADPHIEQVVPCLPHASSHRLLSRTHGLCVFLAVVGFILAIIGILCYAWAFQPASVSIFASVSLGVALLSTSFLCI